MSLSSKQILSIVQSTKRINIWCGAVRSGKTHASLLKFINLLRDGPDGNAMIVGVSREALQRNIIHDISEMLGVSAVSAKTNEMVIFGRRVYIVGANDESAVRRIQGSTLAIGLVDEAAQVPPAFWRMLLSRLSKPGAQLLATCNPEGPTHWLKREFIDRAEDLDLMSWSFELDDNPSLSEDYKANLKREYSGHWYARYILGQWAVAQGLVYDGISEDHFSEQDFPAPDYYIAGIDYGITNPTTCVLVAVSPNRYPFLRVISEYYYNTAEKSRAKTDSELGDDIQEFLLPYQPTAIYIDPSAASLKLELAHRDLPVAAAKNSVLDGIRVVSKFISQYQILIDRSCKNLIREIQSYAWDPKAADRGDDKPIKDNDHVCFIVGTLIATELGNIPIEDVTPGMMVLTRQGYKRVLISMQSEAEQLFEMEAGGRILTGTGNHPIWTKEGKIELMDMAGRREIFITSEASRWASTESSGKSSTGSSIEGILTPIMRAIETISAVTLRGQKGELDICTETSGSRKMDPSRAAGTFTTSTETPLTMTRRILFASIARITRSFTRLVKSARKSLRNYSTACATKPLTGTEAKRVGHGIESRPGSHGVEERLSNSNAVNAGKPTIRGSRAEESTVQTTVEQQREGKAGWMTRTESVEIAVRALLSLSTPRPGFAAGHADTNTETATPVFNLHVEDESEYFANGILVGNCDALRYCLYTAFPDGLLSNPDDELTIAQVRRKAYGDSQSFGFFNSSSGYS